MFTSTDCDEMCRIIDSINHHIRILNEQGEDVIIKYTDFNYLKQVYNDGLAGK